MLPQGNDLSSSHHVHEVETVIISVRERLCTRLCVYVCMYDLNTTLKMFKALPLGVYYSGISISHLSHKIECASVFFMSFGISLRSLAMHTTL